MNQVRPQPHQVSWLLHRALIHQSPHGLGPAEVNIITHFMRLTTHSEQSFPTPHSHAPVHTSFTLPAKSNNMASAGIWPYPSVSDTDYNTIPLHALPYGDYSMSHPGNTGEDMVRQLYRCIWIIKQRCRENRTWTSKTTRKKGVEGRNPIKHGPIGFLGSGFTQGW